MTFGGGWLESRNARTCHAERREASQDVLLGSAATVPAAGPCLTWAGSVPSVRGEKALPRQAERTGLTKERCYEKACGTVHFCMLPHVAARSRSTRRSV